MPGASGLHAGTASDVRVGACATAASVAALHRAHHKEKLDARQQQRLGRPALTCQ